MDTPILTTASETLNSVVTWSPDLLLFAPVISYIMFFRMTQLFIPSYCSNCLVLY